MVLYLNWKTTKNEIATHIIVTIKMGSLSHFFVTKFTVYKYTVDMWANGILVLFSIILYNNNNSNCNGNKYIVLVFLCGAFRETIELHYYGL